MTAFGRWLGVLLALPGMAAIELPFYEGVSPMNSAYLPNAILCLAAFG